MNTLLKGQRFRKEECVYHGATGFVGRDRLDKPVLMFRHRFWWPMKECWLTWNTQVRVKLKINSNCEFSFTPLERGPVLRAEYEPELRVTRGKVTNAIAES